MAHLDVFANPGSKTYPYLVDVQADILRDLATRVVVPLMPARKLRGRPITRLNPVVSIDGHDYALLIQELAAVPVSALGTKTGTLKSRRADVVAALDLLFTGI